MEQIKKIIRYCIVVVQFVFVFSLCSCETPINCGCNPSTLEFTLVDSLNQNLAPAFTSLRISYTNNKQEKQYIKNLFMYWLNGDSTKKENRCFSSSEVLQVFEEKTKAKNFQLEYNNKTVAILQITIKDYAGEKLFNRIEEVRIDGVIVTTKINTNIYCFPIHVPQ